jgi:hypothetical protein
VAFNKEQLDQEVHLESRSKPFKRNTQEISIDKDTTEPRLEGNSVRRLRKNYFFE